jgi:hypothetical protein
VVALGIDSDPAYQVPRLFNTAHIKPQCERDERPPGTPSRSDKRPPGGCDQAACDRHDDEFDFAKPGSSVLKVRERPLAQACVWL